ncbi:MAG TPA: MFS transporter [Candidatus Limnocylindria bacterium]|jgi:EmrB/QacA subfamily drug resistance transporter|nr:MFS transporter [Candidatus Limnocylindria bacterium]
MAALCAGTMRLVDPSAPAYRWWLLAVTSIGALLASITSGSLIIALPQILVDLRTDLFAVMWIIVGYTLVVTVLVLNAGRLADRFGRARTYTLGSAAFTAASVCCAMAPSAGLLVAARVGQGIGAAFMFANSAALVTDAFDRSELGRALGINAMVIGAGLILGPILGGWLTGFGWRWVFWFNVPIGIAATLAAWLVLVERHEAQRELRIDWWGSAIYLAALLSLMTSLAFGGLYGWGTWWVIGGIVLAVALTPLLLWVELHVAGPLLDLSLFRDRLFTLGNITGLLNGIARYSVLFLLVFYLQGVKGADPVTAGIELAPLAIGMVVFSPISGALSDRWGSRLLATAGMVVTGIGLAGLAFIEADTPLWQLFGWQALVGAGSGIFNSPNTSAVMGVVPPAKRGIGAGMRAMLTNTGFVISIALAVGLLTSSMDPAVLLSIVAGVQTGSAGIDMAPFIGALHVAFLAGVGASAMGAVISMMRGRHRSWGDEPAVSELDA